MLKGTKKYWLIAVLCGMAAAIFSYQYLQEIKQRYSPDNLIQVVKAKENIKKDSVINGEQVQIVTVPANFIHPDALLHKQDAVGKIAISDISAGEEILKAKILASNDKSNRLAYSIEKSKRAVSIPVDNISGVSGFIKAGDKVDIIATIDIPVTDYQGNEKATSFSIVTLQDIQVLAVGHNPEIGEKNTSVTGKTLTLAVSLQEAQPLILASERGHLRLLLRNPVDESKSELVPLQLKDLLRATSPQS